MNWFKNLNAVPKIMTALGGVLFFLLPIGYLAITEISQLRDVNRQIFSRDVGGIDAIKQAEVDEALMLRALAVAAVSSGNREGVDSAERDFTSLLVDLRLSLRTAHTLSSRGNLGDQLQSATSLIPTFERAGQDLFGHLKTGEHVAPADVLKTARVAADQLHESLHQASVIKRANVEIFKADEEAGIGRARAQFAWLLFAAVAFGLSTSFFTARSFSVPLRQAVCMLGLVEQGDLTQRLDISGEHEIGQLAKALNAALTRIREVMSHVAEASRNLTSASLQLAQSTDVMATGAHEQAASLEQTSASLEQITATVRQNSDNARQASQFAMSSRDAAEKGGSVVHSAMSAMNEINEASTKIAAIIRVIDEIAFQTNLLAVNASVEAARAREHGKGFAVVATEVRTLAQRSGSAAKEIKALIGDSRRKVENGSVLVNRSGKTLTDIVAAVKRVTDIVSEIAAASREQSTGIEQVNKAMLQMDRVMQTNSSHTEQISGTANVLASQAERLEQLISGFVVDSSAPSAKEVKPESSPAASLLAKPVPQAPPADSAPASSALSNLAANLGHPMSTAALDEEFKEF